MSAWDDYPEDYRCTEVDLSLSWIRSGECAAIIGLSGSGKSNLAGFMANRAQGRSGCPRIILIDCNLIREPSRLAFLELIISNIEGVNDRNRIIAGEPLMILEEAIQSNISSTNGISLIFDRFDGLYDWKDFEILASNLRALRDRFKYKLTFILFTRKPIKENTELAELFFGHTLWLGPLSRKDALWSARRDLKRFLKNDLHSRDNDVVEKLVSLSSGYPSLLRAACEAYASGATLEIEALRSHPAIVRRVAEFWSELPDQNVIKMIGMEDQPLLLNKPMNAEAMRKIDRTQLTSKENLLLEFLMAHEGKVCEKNDLVQAVWPEDVIFERGVRDESLAQLVRRLRVKIETDPAEPEFIHTIPGRGYLFRSR